MARLLDHVVLLKEQRDIPVDESLLLTVGYIGLGLAFGAWVGWYINAQSGIEYLTSFAVEKALATDNEFVIAMILAFEQHRQSSFVNQLCRQPVSASRA